jgi:crotonobetainyl-CoA:carnitine CoA-transferase CaiB-like acyl-CoA transferase
MREAPSPMADRLVLDDLHVLELGGGIAAAVAARFLHGYGAHVTRFEPIEVVPPVRLTPSQRIAYLSGIAVVTGPASELPDRVAAVDMIVTDRQPSELRLLGLDFTALRSARPELIVVSVTPFGLSGPNADLPSTNAVSFAAGGIMSITGDSSRTPLLTGGEHAYALGGANAFAAATMAWLGRARTGRGDLVDISLQECAAGMLEYYGPMASYLDAPAQLRLGNQSRATWGIYPCLDGWAGVFALARQVPALFGLLDDPELVEPRFSDQELRLLEENEAELTVKLYVFFSDLTMAEIRELSLKSRVPFGVVMTPADVLAGKTPADRGFWDEVAVSDGSTLRMPGRPFPGFAWSSDAPARSASVAPASDGNAPDDSRIQLPLAGLRVLDLTMMWAGPFATLKLAEMGADVVKVESPSAWDNIRTLIPSVDEVPDPWNSAFYFNAYNRDKRSLTLDLAQPAGRELLLRLVEHCDVVIENYRSDVLDNLGLGYEILRRHKPDIILISMAAFGKTGADSAFVGFGPVIEMLSGLASLTGYGDGEPYKTGISYGDPVAGTFAVSAVGLALKRRMATGEGIHIDLAQRETAAVLIGDSFVDAADGSTPAHRGNRDAVMAPQGCYRITHAERWLVLSVRSDSDWLSLCSVIERPDLSGLSVEERHARHGEIDAAIETWLASETAPAEPEDVLRKAGVPAIEMRNTRTLLDDPHLEARGYWHNTHHPRMHTYRQAGVSWPFVESRPKPRRHSPLFGEHNTEILQDILGVSDAELADLTTKNVIADAPINPTVG